MLWKFAVEPWTILQNCKKKGWTQEILGKKNKLKNEERGIILSGSQLYTLYAPVVYSIFLFRNKNIYFEGTCITL